MEDVSRGVYVSSIRTSQFVLPAVIVFGDKTETISFFLDSGAGVNLIDAHFARTMGLSLCTLQRPIPIFAIDSAPLSQRNLTHIVHNLHLRVGDHHNEMLSCYVLEGLPTPVVLGLPWLVAHNPVVDWQAREILEWSEQCRENCLTP